MATTRLYSLIGEFAPGTIPLDAIRDAIAAGADVLFTPKPDEMDPILHRLVLSGQTEAALACLEGTTQPLDLTVEDRSGRTVPQCIVVNGSLSGEEVKLLAAAAVRHIETHPTAQINWAATDIFGRDIVQLASRYHLLKYFWSAIKGMPFFDDRTEPISLKDVWEEDFNALPAEDRERFDIRKSFINLGRECTARLLQLTETDVFSLAHLTAVERYVAEGADVVYHQWEKWPPVLMLLRNAQGEAALRCLRSPHPIDFTVTDAVLNQTPLHYIAFRFPSPATSKKKMGVLLLEAVIDHLERFPSDDKIDWGQKDGDGDTCLSEAARNRWLSSWWDVMKRRNIAFYTQHKGKIRIRQEVHRMDWNRISKDDQKRFILSKGVRAESIKRRGREK